MLHRYRQLGLAAFIGLVGVTTYAGFSMQTHAAGRGTTSHYTTVAYTAPSQSANSMTGMDMPMARPSKGNAKAVVHKHQHTIHVSIRDLAFGPTQVVVSPGTTVVWTNRDSFEHTSTSDHGLWDSHPIAPNTSFSHVFKKAGTFTYHCTIHPFMHGTITVAR